MKLKNYSSLLRKYALLLLVAASIGTAFANTAMKPLSVVLEELGEKYQVFFTYDAEELGEVDVNFSLQTGERLDKAIGRLLASTNYVYETFGDKYYVIRQKGKIGKKKVRKFRHHIEEIQKLEQSGLSLKRYRADPVDQLQDVLQTVYAEKVVKPIIGTITDETGEPLIGVTILVKNTNVGTTTDFDGNFSLDVPDDATTLVISYTGYSSMEIDIENQSNLTIVMQDNISSLDEIVVIGYGTTKVRDLTGSVQSVDLAAIDQQPNVSIMQGIAGAVPGLNIGQVDQAGENPSISIRGQTSISGELDPLVVIDGIIFRGNLIDINPSDVKSIEVLKDASATAIYGSQASNGVILLTTKSGGRKDGKPIINFSTQMSISEPTHELRAQGSEAFIKKVEESDIQQSRLAPDYLQPNPDWAQTTNFKTNHEINQFEAGNSFDWYDHVTRDNPLIVKHNLSIANSTDVNNYFASVGYTRQEGNLRDEYFDRINGRINLGTSVTDWLKIDIQSFFSLSNYGPQTYTTVDRFIEPYATPFDQEGTLVERPFGNSINPLIEDDAEVEDQRLNLNGIFTSTVKLPIEGLSYQFRFGNNHQSNTENVFEPHGFSFQGFGSKRDEAQNSWSADNILSYSRAFGNNHELDVTLLYGVEERNFRFTEAQGSNFVKGVLGFNSLQVAAADQQKVFSGGWNESSLYNMGRISYRFMERYLITGTVRRDGFSGFSQENKFGTFPSVALGWIISDEPFFEGAGRWLSFLKLRASYGSTGNRTIGRYQILAEVDGEPGYVTADGTSLFAQWISALESPDLKWEKTTGINIGLDFRLQQGRFSGSINYYNNNTSDLLYEVDIPALNRFEIFPDNLGEIHNEGLEITFSSTNILAQDFKWSTDLSFSRNRNKINTLLGFDVDGDGNEDDLISEGLFIGQSLGAIYDYTTDGFWQLTDEIPNGYEFGSYKVVDLNGDGSWNGDDRSIIGNRLPAYRFGLNNVMTYKNWTLRFFINAIQGGKNRYLGQDNLYNLSIFNTETHFNQAFPAGLNYWTPENSTGATYQRPGIKGAAGIRGNRYTQRNFVRLRDAALSYSLGAETIPFIQSLRLTLSSRNLLTLTKWPGWDPETGIGINDAGRPVMRSYSFGLDVSF